MMEEKIGLPQGDRPLVPEAGQARFYPVSQISWTTFFFGPMAGAWFLSRNWKVLGEDGVAFRTFLTGILLTQAIFVGVQFLPDNFPDAAVPAAYTAIAAGIVKKQQSRLDEQKVEFTRATGMRTFFMGLLMLGLTLLMAGAVFIAIDTAFPHFLPEHHKAAPGGH